VGAYRWTGDLAKLKIIHIDKSAKIRPEKSKKKIQTYAVFVMNFSEMIDIGDFAIENIDKITEAIENASLKLNNNQQETCDPSTPSIQLRINSLRASSTELVERFSIISYFLYRTKPAGLWMDASGGVDRHGLTRLFLDTD
jgi:hypothetical protein